jgi:hypothetical protein
MEERSDKTALGLTPRLIAAGWFAVAALIGILSVVVVLSALSAPSQGRVERDSHQFALLGLMALPIAIASLFGFTLGSRILDSQQKRSAPRSVVLGMLIAFLSYLTMPIFHLVWALILVGQGFESQNALTIDPYWILAIWGVGAILVGWLLLIAGGTAGFLLFKFSLRETVQRKLAQSPRVSKEKAYVWFAIAPVILIAVFVLIAFGPTMLNSVRRLIFRAPGWIDPT